MEIATPSVIVELGSSECWQLLRDAPFGRLAVVSDGRPDIFPVNHVVDRGSLVFRSDRGTKLLAAVGQPVAFEVDGYDARSGEAWSVVVKGRAREVRQLHEVVDTVDLPLFPWQGGAKPRFVRIEPDVVTGKRFATDRGARRAAAGAPGRSTASD